MNYLSPEQVLFLHSRLIAETGGASGVRDLGLLQSAVARPQARGGKEHRADAQDLYPTLFSKSAALLDSLVRNHPFVDGNKRTGIAAAGLLLRRNGFRLNADNAELEAFTLAVACSELDLAAMTAWLEAHSRPER